MLGDKAGDLEILVRKSPKGSFNYRIRTAPFKNRKDARDLCDAFKAAAVREKTSIRQSTTEASIDTDQPIALSFISDVHLGSPHTNYEAFFADVDTIAGDPRLYLMKGGDWCDKFMGQFKDKMAPANALQPPQIQLLVTERLMKHLGKAIVAICGGNHDNMDSRQTGISTEYFIHRDLQIPVLPQGGLVELNVGGVVYKILWKHNYRFNSSLNQFNAHHRMLETLAPDADVVVMEHEHNPGCESIEKYDLGQQRTVVNIRTGTYKESDPFSMQYFKAGQRGPQTIILWPKEKKILALHGRDALTDAVTYLNGVREYPKKVSNAKKEKGREAKKR